MHITTSHTLWVQNRTALLLRLLQIPRMGAAGIRQLLLQLSDEELLAYDNADFQQIGWQNDQIQRWFKPKLEYIEPALQWADESTQQHIISSFDADYPFMLKQTIGAPLLLFVKGDIGVLSLPQIAIVGSRYHSNYGEYWAKYFAQQLVANNFVITSGLALGIDGLAHQAVVDVGGQTVAVLGSGLAKIYPSRHRQLAQQIIDNNGAVISEFIPHQPAVPDNFPRRNRIISGLSQATLVVEAAEKSGSLITARYALEQNREVFALPSSIQSQFSRGCHALIKQGAMLVESVTDILENLSLNWHGNIHLSTIPQPTQTAQRAVTKPLKPVSQAEVKSQINAVENCSHPELYRILGYTPLSLDDLSEMTQLDFTELTMQLLALELEGIICLVEGGYCRR